MLRTIFSGDRREQYILVGIAGLGFVFALIALFFLSGDNGSNQADDAGPTSTATSEAPSTAAPTTTRTATATSEPTNSGNETATLDPSATVTEEPDETETPTPDSSQGSNNGSGPSGATATSPPVATSMPVPTATTAASAFAYCDTGGSSAPPTGSVLGFVTIAGVVPPPGTIVTLTFDGIPGPSEPVTIEDGVAGYSLNYSSGGVDCANQAGAAIAVLVNGQSFPTGHAVGDGDLAVLFSVDLS